MTEGELIEHLQQQIDVTQSERLALFALGLGLLRMAALLAGLVPPDEWARLERHHGSIGRKLLDQAVELLQTNGDSDGRIAGIDVDELRQKLHEVEQRSEPGR